MQSRDKRLFCLPALGPEAVSALPILINGIFLVCGYISSSTRQCSNQTTSAGPSNYLIGKRRHIQDSYIWKKSLFQQGPANQKTSAASGISLDNTLNVNNIESGEIRNGNMLDKPRRTGTMLFARNYEPYDETRPFSALQQVKELDSMPRDTFPLPIRLQYISAVVPSSTYSSRSLFVPKYV